ncbi:Beta sliding clamp [Moorella thermoacetica]|uniref:Beta sliding clamp n=1 Tax=Neomoorella thermoacetica TaxID=1525 RepID=A0AAC9HF21_NEOTH|nr:DNA polymerase III subunit beta [Moorella thermoacetica]AOQ22503.1 DNA polymerase III subunit beta [Moorella thermoacetica]TYL13252.1 Beta sliding clamp [Moorella thermoacetica]
MHILCPQPQLVNAVQKVYRAVATTTTYHAITGILLQAHENTLTLQGTDLDLGIIYTFPVEVIEEGELLLPARIFTEMVRRLPPTSLSLQSLQDNTVEIAYQQSKVQLNSIDASQFPLLPPVEGNFSFTVAITALKDAIRKVTIAAGNDDLRSIFNGVLWELEPGENRFNLVATDTHRLAVYHGQPEDSTSNETATALVPCRAMNELARLLPGEDGLVKITIGESQIYAQHEGLTLYTRLLNGKFPHYQQVIPTNHITTIEIATRDLLDTVERATLLARDENKARAHIIILQVGEKSLKITSEAAEIGHLEEELTAEIAGQPLELALNGRYLLETLRVIDTENVILELLAPLKPVVVRPAGQENYFCLILPVRIG